MSSSQGQEVKASFFSEFYGIRTCALLANIQEYTNKSILLQYMTFLQLKH